MKFLRHLTLLLFLFFLLLHLPIRTEASYQQIASGSDSEVATPSNPVRVISVTHPDYDLNDMPALKYVQTYTDFNNHILLDVMDFVQNIGKVEAVLLLPDGSKEKLNLSVSINRQSLVSLISLDPRVTGTSHVLADINFRTIDISYGTYTLDDDISQQITIPIKIIIPEETVYLTHLDAEYAYIYNGFKKVISVLPNDDLLEILSNDSDDILYCSSDSNARYYGQISWDGRNVNLDQPGIYRIPVIFHSPLHCTMAENIVLPDAEYYVIVQEPEKPEIYEYSQIPGGIYFPWKISSEHVEDIKVWLSKDYGPWVEMPNNNSCGWNETGLYFTVRFIFEPNSSYRLQVDYRDGKTNILSFTYEDIIVINEYYQGDRDGGDTNGNPPLIGGGKPSDENTSDSVIGGNTFDNNNVGSEDTSTNSPESTPGKPAEPLPKDDTTTEAATPDETTSSAETAEPDETTISAETAVSRETIASNETTAPGETTSSTEATASDERTMSSETEAVQPTVETESFLKETIPESSSSVTTAFSEETSATEGTVRASEITHTLPVVTAVAAIAAIASLLFLIFTKRWNGHDKQSP